MNKERRKRLGKAFDLVTEAEQIIQEVMEEERESMQNYIDMMDEVIGYCQDAESVIEQI